MIIIDPIDIMPAMVVSNTAIDESLPQWVAGTYSQGAEVIYNRHIYEVLASTTTDRPDLGVLKTPATWLDVGAVNSWRMFDERIETQSTADTSLVVQLQTGSAVTAASAFNVSAVSMTVRMTDPSAGVVVEETRLLADVGVSSWWEYFFKPIDRTSDVIISDLPSYPLATIEVIFSEPTGTAAVGFLTLGVQVELGMTLSGVSAGIIDYSRKTTDEFGRSSVVRRGFSKRAEYDVAVDTEQTGRVQRILAGVRSKPVVWIGDKDKEATIVIGFFRDFNINVRGVCMSDATISVEGLV